MIDITTIGVGVDTAKLKAGTRELDNFGKSADAASRKADGLTDKNEKTSKSLTGMISAAKFAAIGLSAAGVAALAMGSAVLDSFIKLEKLNNSLKFSTGSAKAAAQEIEYLKTISNRLGLEFLTTADAFAKFSAATKGTAIEGQKTRDVFESIAKASTVLGLSADETKGALNAIQQMMSKGTVSAEELRGQLGERLPGAFNIAAKAMGITTQELGKMLEQGQLVASDFLPKFAAELTKTLGDSPESAAGSAQAQLNKLTNAWTEFKQVIAESGVITIVVKLVEGTAGALKFITTGLSDISGDKTWQKTKLSQLMQMRDDKNFRFFSEAQINTDIGKLRRSLGIAQQFDSQTNPSTGLNPNGSIAPNFGVTKKDGTGGYDARLNNQAQLDKLALDNAKKYQKSQTDAQKAEITKRMGAQELEYTTEALQWEKRLNNIEQVDEAKAKAYKEDLKRINALQDVANDNYKEAQRAFVDAEKEKLREFEKTVDGINQVFREGFANLVNGGKGSWKAFTKSLFTTFKTTVADSIYKLFAQPFVVKLVASILGVGASGSTSAAGMDALTGTGSNSLFGSIKDLSSNIQGGLTGSIEKLGAFFANGNGGIGDSIGGFLGQNAGAIANYAPYAGALIQAFSGDLKGAAFTAAGAAIGSFIPGIGTAIGAAVGGLVGGLFGGKKQPPRTVTQLPEVGGAFGDSFNALLSGFGSNQKASASVKYAGRAGGSGYGTIDTNVGGAISGLQVKQKDAYSEESMKAFVNQVLGVELVKAIKSSNLSAGIKKFFDGLVDPQEVNQSISFLTGLNKALKDMPPIFNAVRNALDTTAYKTSLSQLEATFANTSTFTSLFYTEAENFETFTKQIKTQLGSLNSALPISRDAYRKLVDSIKVTNEATFNQYSGLVALAPAMDAYFKQLEQEKLIKQQIAGIDINRFKTFLDFNIAKSYVNAGMNIPAANMPSYAVGTDYVPNDGVAMLHQGEAVLTRSDNQSMSANTGAMVGLLKLVVTEIGSMKADIKRVAENSRDTVSELRDITGGDAILKTEAA